jgi:predicted naringenin-chalcone synthase
MLPVFISDFSDVAPPYLVPQQDGLRWLAEAHAVAEGGLLNEERVRFYQKMLQRFGCHEPAIERRGTWLKDYTHLSWDGMRLHRLHENPRGAGMDERMRFFDEVTNRVVAEIFAQWEDEIPSDAIHVTCTGYSSPSSFQRWLGQKHPSVLVTHAYHMGCYASIPAIRMAAGFLSLGRKGAPVDVIHTELCTLHLNPGDHNPEQLVVQSLFADGVIGYRVRDESKSPAGLSLRLLAVAERLVPGSAELMKWVISEHGMAMTLSREVPTILKGVAEDFVGSLFHQAGLNFHDAKAEALFAIHPGGPKIIDSMESLLELKSWQTEFSRAILRSRGNMSSATLPYIWRDIAKSDCSKGQKIVSLAFGPGLTIAGAILEKN